MGYEQTSIFTNGMDSKLSDYLEDSEINEIVGIKEETKRDVDVTYHEGKLSFEVVDKNFVESFGRHLYIFMPYVKDGYTDLSEGINNLLASIEELYIGDFIGDFDHLLLFLEKFSNLKKVAVSVMVHVGIINITRSYKGKYVLTIDRCSAYMFDADSLSAGHEYPRIVLKDSLFETIGLVGNVKIREGIEEKLEDITEIGGCLIRGPIELPFDKRFNGVTIFNKIFKTKLRTLHGLEYEVKLSPMQHNRDLSESVRGTKFGYTVISTIPFCITYSLKLGDFKADRLGVDVVVGDYDE